MKVVNWLSYTSMFYVLLICKVIDKKVKTDYKEYFSEGITMYSYNDWMMTIKSKHSWKYYFLLIASSLVTINLFVLLFYITSTLAAGLK